MSRTNLNRRINIQRLKSKINNTNPKFTVQTGKRFLRTFSSSASSDFLMSFIFMHHFSFFFGFELYANKAQRFEFLWTVLPFFNCNEKQRMPMQSCYSVLFNSETGGRRETAIADGMESMHWTWTCIVNVCLMDAIWSERPYDGQCAAAGISIPHFMCALALYNSRRFVSSVLRLTPDNVDAHIIFAYFMICTFCIAYVFFCMFSFPVLNYSWLCSVFVFFGFLHERNIMFECVRSIEWVDALFSFLFQSLQTIN